jgi:transposase-like protein
VAQLGAGASLAEAARLCGLGPRTLRTWRSRAWSHRTADAPFVSLEKRIQHARELDLKATILASACATVDEELERLALNYAERVAGIRVEAG